MTQPGEQHSPSGKGHPWTWNGYLYSVATTVQMTRLPFSFVASALSSVLLLPTEYVRAYNCESLYTTEQVKQKPSGYRVEE